MQFDDQKNIFLQIGDWITDQILYDVWNEGDRVPSVRDLAEEMLVNRNTVNRSFITLQEQGILENRRGMGYYVAGNAKKIIKNLKKEVFFSEQLPRLINIASQLQLTTADLQPLIDQLNQNENENK